ncbi:MAG: universal stress protein [Candidatus Promineifilaceae bacterium]|jgi:nucleotide-binding universal stress UspA family protein
MRVLIATGGGAHSNLAVQMGAQLAADAGLAPTLMMVIKHEAEYSHAEIVLARAVALMGLKPGAVKTRIRIGNPAKKILLEAEAGKFDLVILGSRPTHTLLTRLLGSTAEWVIAHAPCPVLIAKGNPTPLRRILLCVTAAEIPSQHALFTARLVSQMDEAPDITVLHVMSQISAGPEAPGEWQLYANASELIQGSEPEGELLRRDMTALALLETNVRPRVRHGPVVEEILKEMQEGDYDLLVIGAHQARGWQRFLLDDLAHQIVVQADRPVLVV